MTSNPPKQNDPFSNNLLRTALRALKDSKKTLSNHPLAELRIVESKLQNNRNRKSYEKANAVCDVVEEGLEKLKPDGEEPKRDDEKAIDEEWQHYIILKWQYVDGIGRDAMENKIGYRSSQYTRLQNEALEKLGEELKKMEWERENELHLKFENSISSLSTEGKTALYALASFAPKPASFSREAAQVVMGVSPGIKTNIDPLHELIKCNLVESMEDKLVLDQIVANLAGARTKKLKASAIKRHYDYYLALANLANKDPQYLDRIHSSYKQIQWAWKVLLKNKEKNCNKILDYIYSLEIYQGKYGLWKEALEWAKVGLKLSENKGWREEQGELHRYIGDIYYNLGQLENASKHSKDAQSILKRLHNPSNLAAVLMTLGNIQYRKKKIQESIEYYQGAQELIQNEDDQPMLVECLIKLGITYNEQGESQKAQKCLNEAKPILEKINDSEMMAVWYMTMGHIDYKAEKFKKALDFYIEVKKIYEKVKSQKEKAVSLTYIGDAYRKQKNFKQAKKNYEEARKIYKQVPYQRGEAKLFHGLGRLYEQKNYQAAKRYYKKAREIYKEMGDLVNLEKIKTILSALESSKNGTGL